MRHHIVYLFANFPLLIFLKIGKGGKGKATVMSRAKQVSRAAPGFSIPIGIMIVPFFAGHVEKFLHMINEPIRVRFYRGDGSTEWFLFLAAAPYYACMALNWLAWYWVFESVLKNI